MDYQSASLAFKLKKVWRFRRMYGWRRTLAKVQSQRHMCRTFDTLPPSSDKLGDRQQIGLIGCGNYPFANIAYFLNQAHGRVIGGCMDINADRAASLAAHYRVPMHTTDVSDLMENENIRLLYIASNHASHAEYAIEGLKHGKDVYIEKPHVVNEDQLGRLVDAFRSSTGRVYLGFNRPGSRFGRILREAIDNETGPGIYNWFVAGHEIDPDHWYFHPKEGGRVLGNLCHWTDFLYVLLGENAFPIQITPIQSQASDADISVNYVFGDGSIGVITFSAKGHVFDGVREQLTAHRGNCLATLDDFVKLTVDVVERKRQYRNRKRDHGHRDNILAAYRNSILQEPYDREERLTHLANTAHLFLRTKDALETRQTMVIEPYEFDQVARMAS